MEILKKGDVYKSLPTRIGKYKISISDMKRIPRSRFKGTELREALKYDGYLMVYDIGRRIYLVTRAGAKYFNSKTHTLAIDNIGNFTWIKELDETGLKGKRALTEKELDHMEYVAMNRVYPALGKTMNLENRSVTQAPAMDMEKIRKKVNMNIKRG